MGLLGHVHHGTDVVDSLIQRRKADAAVGKPRAPFVKTYESGERFQPMQEPCVSRLVPHQLEMRNESRRENNVDRAVTSNLVGNKNITTLGIFGRWQHGAALYRAILWAGWTQGQWLFAAGRAHSP